MAAVDPKLERFKGAMRADSWAASWVTEVGLMILPVIFTPSAWGVTPRSMT